MNTAIGDDNPGRPDGPTLILGVELAYELTKGSADVQAASCGTRLHSSYNVTSAKQVGYPFDFALVCGPPNNAGSTSVSGNTADMPQRQVESLVSQLTGEQPTYVLTLNTSDINEGGGCILFLPPTGKVIKVSQSMIPTGSNLTASSDCRKTVVSLNQ